MAPTDIYDDDDAIHALLDDLIASGAPEADTSALDASRAHQDLVFTADTAHVGVNVVNSLLHEFSICTPLPSLSLSGDNASTVLAAALTQLAAVVRGAAANRSLRADAETSARNAHTEVDRLRASLTAARERADTAAGDAVAARREAAAVRRTAENDARRAAASNAEQQSKLAAAAHRERLLVMEARRRDREFAQLQRRVHAIVDASHGGQVLQTATQAPGSAATRARTAIKKAVEDSKKKSVADMFEDMTLEAEAASMDVVHAENERFRNILRAVQEELDDLLVSHQQRMRHGLGAEGVKEAEEDCDEADEEAKGLDDRAGMQNPNTDNGHNVEEDGTVANGDNDNTVGDAEPEDGTVANGNSEYIVDDTEPYPAETRTLSKEEAEVIESELSEEENVIEESQRVGETADVGLLLLDNVTPAPTAEQMQLPFEVIRADFEQSLEDKFRMLRNALHM